MPTSAPWEALASRWPRHYSHRARMEWLATPGPSGVVAGTSLYGLELASDLVDEVFADARIEMCVVGRRAAILHPASVCSVRVPWADVFARLMINGLISRRSWSARVKAQDRRTKIARVEAAQGPRSSALRCAALAVVEANFCCSPSHLNRCLNEDLSQGLALDQPADAVRATPHHPPLDHGQLKTTPCRRLEVQGAMRARLVVVVDVLPQHTSQR